VGYSGPVPTGHRSEPAKPGAAQRQFALLRSWLCWRIWRICSEDSPHFEIRPLQLAEKLGLGKGTIHNAINRTPNALATEWSRVLDYFRVEARQAYDESQRWSETAAGRAWLSGGAKMDGPIHMPDPSPALTAALHRYQRRGFVVSPRVNEQLLEKLRQRDRGEDEWSGIIETLHSQEESGERESGARDGRSVAAKTRHPESHEPKRAKSLPSDGVKRSGPDK